MNHSPVKVRNPVSLQHLVIIHPNQEIELRLDKQIFSEEVTVQISSEYLNLKKVIKDSDTDVYQIKANSKVDRWDKYSQSMLGEIWIDSVGFLSKVLVVMESTGSEEKKRNLTIVNPDYHDIKVKPYTTIEVVVYDKTFGFNDEWVWEWMPNEIESMEVEIKEVNYCNLNLYSWHHFPEHYRDDTDDEFSRCPRLLLKDIGPNTQQHHFWFRFDKSIVELFKKTNGVQQVGNFIFRGYADRYHKKECKSVDYGFTLFADLRSKYHKESEFVLDSPILIGKKKKQNKIIIPEPKSGYKYKHRYKPQKPLLPEKKKVVIKKIPFAPLEEGCRVLSSDPKKFERKSKGIILGNNSDYPSDPYGFEEFPIDDCPENSRLWQRLYRKSYSSIDYCD